MKDNIIGVYDACIDCNKCAHLNMTEEEQKYTSKPHICLKYNSNVIHKAFRHPHNSRIIPCEQCKKDIYINYKERNIK